MNLWKWKTEIQFQSASHIGNQYESNWQSVCGGKRVNVCVDNYIKHESFAYIYNLSLYEVVLLDRYWGKEKERACYVLFFILTAGVHLIFCSPGMSVITNIVLIFLITVCYEGALKKKIFVTLLVYGTNMGCDLVAVHLLTDYSITGKVGECAAYITVLLLLICDVISEKSWLRIKEKIKLRMGWYWRLFQHFVWQNCLLLNRN